MKAYLVSGDFDPLMAFVPLAGTLGLFMQKDEFLSFWLAAGTSTSIQTTSTNITELQSIQDGVCPGLGEKSMLF